MVRFLFVPLSCLLVAGCALSPPDAGTSSQLFVAPSLTATVEPGGPSAWRTEDLGPAASVPVRGQDVDDDDSDDPFDDMDNRHWTILLGERQLDDDEWEPVEDQFSAGLAFDAVDGDSGNGFEAGFTYSSEDDSEGPVDVDANVFDLYAGYRYTFDVDGDGLHGEHDATDDDDLDFHPYVGAGGALVRGDAEVDTPGGDDSDDDISPGAYIKAGIGVDLGDRTRLGLDYRHLFLSDMDIGSIDDADFDQFMLTLGFVF